MSPQDALYNAAKISLNKHMTLDPNVPNQVGCAEAVSAVIALVGVKDGPKGIAGTSQLHDWLAQSPRFKMITDPEEAAIVVSPTGSGNGKIEGHTGIFGSFGAMYPGDFGVMSNDSATGRFLERWNWARWTAYYTQSGGLKTKLYRFLG